MVIILKNNIPKKHRYGRTQFRYATIYTVITMVVLIFLNIICSHLCKNLFQKNKNTTMMNRTQHVSIQMGSIDQLTPNSVADVALGLTRINVTQLIITDKTGAVLYCSDGALSIGEQLNKPYLQQALNGYDIFNWDYHSGLMRSEAMVPIYKDTQPVGCVYALELDYAQGSMIQKLQRTILIVTITLEILVIIFSIIFSRTFSKRLDKIMDSIRILQEGDFTHKVNMHGHDELTVLGEEFNDLTHRLQISENKRRQFVCDASHELKTPLASIKLLSDSILQNEMDVETIREFVNDIGNEAERLNRMSEKLLSLTRGESEDEVETCEIIPMGPTIARVAKMLSANANSSQVTIITKLENDVPILIHEDDLYQIAFNLAENGIKYNVPGGKLTLSLRRTEDSGILEVSDTGTGIPEDCLEHIFERFYRVDKARSRATGGSGLGLALVKNMVERNQGTIQVQSTFGKGTTFTVEFPAFETEEGESS